jgi:2-dehydropantoate 2-reductase
MNDRMARIAIVGVGAIGAVTAAILQQSGRHELLLCARRPLPGLTVESLRGPVEVRAPVLVDPAAAPAVDWVIVATKAYDAAGASLWFPRLRDQGAPVAVLQNGVEHRERFAPYLPSDAIVPVMVDCPAERDAPGRVRQRGPMHLRAADDANGRAFIDLFAGTEVDAATHPDMTTVLWRKLCSNSAGILSALLLQPAKIMHREDIAAAAREIVRECVLVGRAEGAKLADDTPEAVVRSTRAAAPDSMNSLHADRLAGRPMEIDARNGAVIRFGLRHGIPTPCNCLAVALLRGAVSDPPNPSAAP